MYGLNLTQHNYPALHGTLQASAADCARITNDVLLLPAFDRAVKVNREQVDYGKGLATSEEKFHYYLDLQNQYIYFYDLINTHQFAMHHWAFLQKGSLGIHQADIDELFSGRTVLSSIYQDDRTELNVMSFLTPVYLNGKLKGIVMVDINKHNLQNIVFTHDRPWSGVISMPASRIPTRIRQLLSIKAKIIFFPTLITSAIFPAVCTSSYRSIFCISLSLPGNCFCFTCWRLPCSSIWSGCISAFTTMSPVKISAMR